MGVKPKTSTKTTTYDYPDLVRLDDYDDDDDDEDDDLSFETKSALRSVGIRLPLKNVTLKKTRKEKSRSTIPCPVTSVFSFLQGYFIIEIFPCSLNDGDGGVSTLYDQTNFNVASVQSWLY